MKSSLALLLLLFSLLLGAQSSSKMGASGAVSAPRIKFEVLWPAAVPQSYTLVVDSTGKGSYVSASPDRKDTENQQDEAYQLEFTLSAKTREKVFDLAKRAQYFNGDFDYKRPVASTGQKTLTYEDPSQHFQAKYNYTENKPVRELTELFQGISSTLQYGRRLQFKYHYDKLGLENELKGMEEAAKSQDLAEVQLIAPTLKKIADDSTVLNIARQRAKRLLSKADSH